LILCVCAISKKHLKPKRKKPFCFEIFLPIAGRRKGGERGGTKKEKTKKWQYTHRINSNLPGESIARESERVLLFVNRGKITPLLQKAI